MHKVSIITACLNAAAHIETALESVRDQTYPDIEHVIIDGGSTDGTLDIVQRYRDSVGYFVSEPDRGVYHAMNKGIQAATGDILFFLGADDRFVDERVVGDTAVVFDRQPDLKIAYGDIIWQLPNRQYRRQQPATITREYLGTTTVIHQTVFARREVFAITGGFSERYRIISDYEWMVKVFLRDRHLYAHFDRDIAIMGTGGISWTTKWEWERIHVMLKYFGLREILKYRIWPRQKLRAEKFAKAMRKELNQKMNRAAHLTPWNRKGG